MKTIFVIVECPAEYTAGVSSSLWFANIHDANEVRDKMSLANPETKFVVVTATKGHNF